MAGWECVNTTSLPNLLLVVVTLRGEKKKKKLGHSSALTAVWGLIMLFVHSWGMYSWACQSPLSSIQSDPIFPRPIWYLFTLTKGKKSSPF